MAILQNLLWFLDVRTILLCLVVILVLRWLFSGPKGLPPGPRGLPILGNIPAIVWGQYRGLEPHHLFARYAAKYGPVFHLKVFNKTLVILNDYALVKEAFQHPQLSDRPKSLFSEVLKAEGLAASSGELWIELRRFSLTALRSLGVGKTSFEEKIATEAEALMKEMAAFNEKSFNPKPLFGNAVSNVICSVIFGKRYEYTDQEFTNLLDLLSRNTKLLGAGGVLNFFPAMRHLPFLPIPQVISNFEAILQFVTRIIDTHRAKLDADNLEDFTDAYLMEIQHNLTRVETGGLPDGTNAKLAKYGHLSERNIVGTILSLFVAGSETTATTLQWGILYMMIHPDIQQRVQAEIDAVVGRNRLPRMADKEELNFTRAVVWEVQRMANIVPMGIPHCAASDIYLRDYLIPKGALVSPNLWTIFQDPKTWPEPEKFKPDRFLNVEGKAVKPEELIPFSTGRRSCIGEHLAKMELFLFFSYFMHQFSFKKPDNSPALSLKGKNGITVSPVPFDILAIPRD